MSLSSIHQSLLLVVCLICSQIPHLLAIEAYRESPLRSDFFSDSSLNLTVSRLSNLNPSTNLGPVVIFPGFAATSLEQKIVMKEVEHWWCRSNKPWHSAWIALTCFLPEVMQCWHSNFKPVCSRHHTSSSPHQNKWVCTDSQGVTTRPIGNYRFGDTTANEFLDSSFKWKTGYMYAFIEALDRVGLKRNKQVFSISYDWRHSLALQRSELFSRAMTIIELAFNQNEGQSVTLVAHSMGSLLMVDFLSTMTDTWKDKYLSTTYAVGPVFGGAIRSIYDILIGNTYSVPTITLEIARSLVSTWTSVATLNPRDFAFDQVLVEFESVVGTAVFTASNISKLYELADSPYGQYLSDDDFFVVTPEVSPGVELTVIGSTDIDVPDSYLISRNLDQTFSAEPKSFGKGDGTVDVRAMIEILRHWGRNQSQELSFIPIKGVDHTQYFMDLEFVEWFVSLMIARRSNKD
ncbi:hypothetical protein GEMRC1_008152 [Eukaryota sp. GEM-RC1]